MYRFEGDTIVYNESPQFPGHGDASIMILAGKMCLTHEEIACIRWHMGAFDDKANWKYYSAAVKNYPNVLWTHTADMYASNVLDI